MVTKVTDEDVMFLDLKVRSIPQEALKTRLCKLTGDVTVATSIFYLQYMVLMSPTSFV